MKTFLISIDIVALLLVGSTLICGLWIRAQPQVDPSSVRFHVGIALATVLSVSLALIASMIATWRVA